MPALKCHNLHFAVNQNTNVQTISDYLNWFVALDLLSQTERQGIVTQFGGGGPSTCLMRTELDDPACESLFFDGNGELRPKSDYLEIGRRAMRALLQPANSEIDRFRYKFLDNDGTWQKALDIGPNPLLSELIPLASTDSRFDSVMADVRGDLYSIVWWATGLVKASKELKDMRAFLAGRNPVSLADDQDFAQRRDKLQRMMAGIVKDSNVRFHEPWGMVCLFWASGSRQSLGKLAARELMVDRHRP
jgi:hypothetical protein